MHSYCSCRFEMELGTHVFLSHDWGRDELGRDNHQRVSLINKELLKVGYKTWFDADKMAGNIDEKIAQGIEQTEGVIVFITWNYHKKVNSINDKDYCKKEFMYASRVKAKSKMIPIVMEESMCSTSKWSGLVGYHLGGEMFVDMSGDLEDKTYVSQQMEALKRELRFKGIHLQPGIFCSYLSFEFYNGEIMLFSLQNVSL